MATWKVKKYVRANSNCPIDKWLSTLTTKDRMRLRVEIEDMERVEKLKPNTVEKYTGTQLYELKAKGDNKQLRPFGIMQPNLTFVLLSGAIEKGGTIPKSDINKAEALRNEFLKGKGSVKDYL